MTRRPARGWVNADCALRLSESLEPFGFPKISAVSRDAVTPWRSCSRVHETGNDASRSTSRNRRYPRSTHARPTPLSGRRTAIPSKLTSAGICPRRRNLGSCRSTSLVAAGRPLAAEQPLIKGWNRTFRPLCGTPAGSTCCPKPGIRPSARAGQSYDKGDFFTSDNESTARSATSFLSTNDLVCAEKHRIRNC